MFFLHILRISHFLQHLCVKNAFDVNNPFLLLRNLVPEMEFFLFSWNQKHKTDLTKDIFYTTVFSSRSTNYKKKRDIVNSQFRFTLICVKHCRTTEIIIQVVNASRK